MVTGDNPQGGEVPSDLCPSLPMEADQFFRGCYARAEKRFSCARKALEALEKIKVDPPEKRERNPLRIRAHLRIVHAPGERKPRLKKTASPCTPPYRRHRPFGRPAGLWIRTVAILIDLFFLYLLQYIFIHPGEFVPAKQLTSWPSYPFSHMMGLYLSPCLSFREWFQALGLNLPLFSAYFILTTWLWGRTLGKCIVGIHVVSEDGERVGFLHSFLRVLGYYINVLTHGIGFLLILFMPASKGLHDYLSHSRVVED
jgi:uncharacterized RDD family membrane protein YckC